MSRSPAIWSREELHREFAGLVVTARDSTAAVVEVPALPGLDTTSDVAVAWDLQTQDIYEPDMPALAMQWYQALEKPGVVHQVTVRRDQDGWKEFRLSFLDLCHQHDVGCILVGNELLRECEPPAAHTRLRDTTSGDNETAWFERPVWLLQELDALGVVLNTEGDAEVLFGRTADELQGHFVLQFMHPDDHAAAIEMWFSLIGEPGSSRTIRQRALRPDGTERWIESTILNRLDEDRSGTLLSISHDVTERRRQERVLQERALTDPLTGLPNRFAIDNSLADVLAQGPATVAFLDLDGFKSVNDRLGHRVGDTVLQAVGNRLANCAPEAASAGRWGGDEFVLFGPGQCEDELRAAIEVAFAHPISVGEDHWNPRCSYGIAHGGPGDDPDELIRSADTAMYEAKERRAS
ncbi:MAG: GGDEF domain-containing protein [Microthrixaceae bacterium]